MDEPMNCSEEKRELPDVGVDALPLRSTMLRSLRVVSVSSEAFPGAALRDGTGDDEPRAAAACLSVA
jgi:hypothetical protein